MHAMPRLIVPLLATAGLLALPAAPGLAMGYDSLACPELAERRIEYFTNNGFCAPGVAEGTPGIAGRPCKASSSGAADLPQADRTQVEMIIKVEARKDCPAK